MRLQRDSYAPKSCAFDAANVQFLRAHLCKSHPVLQHDKEKREGNFLFQGARVVLVRLVDVSAAEVVSLIAKAKA